MGVHGDESIAYGRVIEAIGVVDAAGYAEVALVSKTLTAEGALVGVRIVPGLEARLPARARSSRARPGRPWRK